VYTNGNYVSAYGAKFGKLNPKANCLADFVVFYQLSLLPGLLEEEVESAMLDYVLQHKRGMAYLYNETLSTLPEVFPSKNQPVSGGYRAIGKLPLRSKEAGICRQMAAAQPWRRRHVGYGLCR